MAKIGCRCGVSIPDSTDFNPSKARFLRDVDTEAVEDRRVALCAGYVQAVLEDRVREWLTQLGFAAEYPSGMPHQEVIADLLMTVGFDRQADLFECYNCGRLLVETSPNCFDFYAPESGKPSGIFRGRDPEAID